MYARLYFSINMMEDYAIDVQVILICSRYRWESGWVQCVTAEPGLKGGGGAFASHSPTIFKSHTFAKVRRKQRTFWEKCWLLKEIWSSYNKWYIILKLRMWLVEFLKQLNIEFFYLRSQMWTYAIKDIYQSSFSDHMISKVM